MNPLLIRAIIAPLIFTCLATSSAAALAQNTPQTTGNGSDSLNRADPSTLTPPPRAVPLSVLRSGADSVEATPGDDYSAWFLHRFVFGDLNRDLWNIPFKVPVLNLDTLGGGVKVLELSGGKQTLGIQLVGKNDIIYQFRSLVKDPRRPMPRFLHKTPVGTVSKDQMAAQFPLAPMVVAELLQAVDVLVAKPHIVIMPDSPRLEEYRDAFSGRMGWIEERPQEREGDEPGFAGSSKITGSDELYEELFENPRSYVDANKLLRARLVDFIVGDWDRHSDQWRWARYPDGDRFRWEPIPRDRDWAFARIDGVLRPIVSMYYPQYVGFRSGYPNVDRLAFASMRVDRTLLTRLDREAFMKTATEVVAALSDATLGKSIAGLPPGYRDAGNEILGAMRARRDNLIRAAEEFYSLLSREPGIYGSEKADSAVLTASGDSLRLRMFEAAPNGLLLYDRTFAKSETGELRLFLLDGDDRVVVQGASPLPFKVRVATGGNDDRVSDATSGDNLYVYNSRGDDSFDLGDKAFATGSDYLTQDSIRTAARSWHSRDWGSSWLLLPSADHEPDVGFLVGLRLTRSGFGFGQQSCHSCLSLEVLDAMRNNEWIYNVSYDRMITSRGVWFANSFQAKSGWATRFYGFGNEVPFADSEIPFTGFRRTIDVQSGLRYQAAETWNVFAGAAYRRYGRIRDGGDIFDDITYGGGQFQQLGARTSLEVDTRDLKALPTRGLVLRASADLYPEALDVDAPFGSARGTLRLYQSFPLPLDPTLHLRAVGQRVWGPAPFADIPWLGGSSTLPGFARSQFRGEAMASGNALLRVKAFSAKLLTDVDVGLHGVTGMGRVWREGEESDTWHSASGGGLWLHLPSIKRTLGVTFVQGNKTRIYFDFGFIF